MNINEKKEYQMISTVSKMLNVHPQTLRFYEKKGLIKPSRTSGNKRLFSRNNIEKIKLIQRLTNELGVNLAGVEVILNMRETIRRLEKEKLELEKKLTD